MLCPICQAQALNYFQNLFVCGKCDTAFFTPSDSEDKNLYSDKYYKKRNPLLKKFYYYALNNWRRRKLQIYGNSGSILDVGCGGGEFLNTLKNGFEVYGLEVSPFSARKIAPVLKDRFYASSIEEPDKPSGRFDLITCWHIIEHLQNPVKGIRNIHKMLKKTVS